MERPRVLVLDPDAASRELIRKVLARRCDLLFQADPLRCLELLEIFEPELTILELELPYLSGFELLGLIREANPNAASRLMIFSALHDVESQKQAYRLGAHTFLVKPCRPSQLFKAAALFVRLASGQCPLCQAKSLGLDEVDARLAELEQQPGLHPLIAAALTAQEQRRHLDELDHHHLSVMGLVARRRPAT